MHLLCLGRRYKSVDKLFELRSEYYPMEELLERITYTYSLRLHPGRDNLLPSMFAMQLLRTSVYSRHKWHHCTRRSSQTRQNRENTRSFGRCQNCWRTLNDNQIRKKLSRSFRKIYICIYKLYLNFFLHNYSYMCFR